MKLSLEIQRFIKNSDSQNLASYSERDNFNIAYTIVIYDTNI